MAKLQCNYKFPCHPCEMFAESPLNMDSETKTLRVQIIKLIAELSEIFSQEDLDEKVYVDVDANNFIQGVDTSELIGLTFNMCLGRRVPLKHLTDANWKNMKL